MPPTGTSQSRCRRRTGGTGSRRSVVSDSSSSAGERADQRVGGRSRRAPGRLDTAAVIACPIGSSIIDAPRRVVADQLVAPGFACGSGSVIVGHSAAVRRPAAAVEVANRDIAPMPGLDAAGRCGRRSAGRACTTSSGGAPAAPQGEVVDDPRRQQADQVRVARQPRVDAVERLRRDRGTADVIQPFQHQHPLAGAGQVGGGDQAVVPAADDDGVVAAQFR